MQDFLIVSPPYMHNSNGIKTLHKICHTINAQGGTARMAFIPTGDPNCQEVVLHDASWTNPDFNTPVLQESERHLIETSYVLYPEVMLGNPFGAKKVIRYFGNREGYCNGKMIAIGPDDFTVAHSVSIRKNAHFILFNSEVNPAFHDHGSLPAVQRRTDVTYIGKGYLYGRVGLVDNTLYVTRDWPPTQEELGELLRRVRYFYTWDSWTSTNVEAVLCGAIPFFLRYEPWKEEDLDGCELGYIPRMDDNKRSLEQAKFDEQRRTLIDRINTLTHSWDMFLRDFTLSVEKHFNERMPS